MNDPVLTIRCNIPPKMQQLLGIEDGCIVETDCTDGAVTLRFYAPEDDIEDYEDEDEEDDGCPECCRRCRCCRE